MLSELYETADWPVVAFPRDATVGNVEKQIEMFYARHQAEPVRLAFDFSNSEFIEIATLQLITSHFRRRDLLKYETKFRLPSGQRGLNARHFLRRWKYAENLPKAIGGKCYFSSFVDRADYKYFSGSPTGGDAGDPYAGVVARYDDRYGVKTYRIESYRFFEFKTWSLPRDVDKRRFVETERRRWRNADPLLIETLNRRLKAPSPAQASTEHSSVNNERLVVGRIAFQAITNSLRHPGARVLQASSHMADRLIPHAGASQGFLKSGSFFTIVYWDDGESMYQTLRKALVDNLPVNHPTGLNATYLVDPVKGFEPDQNPLIMLSTQIPTNESSDKELLVSTIFPGVTCDVRDAERLSGLGLDERELTLAIPGHGLFILIQTAVELFGGSVAFRTGNFFMNVSALSESEWSKQNLPGPRPIYKVKISQSNPAFLGNMVTVRLPLDNSVK